MVLSRYIISLRRLRRAFVRKVYAILMCQLLVTMGVIAVFLFHEPTKKWVVEWWSYMFWGAWTVCLMILIWMACCPDVRRRAPMNLIALSIFTAAMGITLGAVTSLYNVDTVLIAVGLTAVVCLSLTLFAFQTKFDFTGMSGALLCVLVILICFGIAVAIIPSRVLHFLYASIGALVFSLFLVVDTQLMLGGKHKYSLSPEEYIFAALNLYLDIINLFLRILSILSECT